MNVPRFAEQRDFLLNFGCCAYQGYFVSKPLPLADFEKFVGLVWCGMGGAPQAAAGQIS